MRWPEKKGYVGGEYDDEVSGLCLGSIEEWRHGLCVYVVWHDT